MRDWTYLLVKAILKPWLATWFKWSIEGLEHIPTHGAAIVAVNHISYLDPFAAAYVVDKAGRKARFLAKAELFEDKRIAWVLKGSQQIEVKRGTKDASVALEEAYAAIGRGEMVVVFPEGTVTRDPELQPMAAKSGAARLALKTGAPLIPMAVWGTANVWPKGFAKHWNPGQRILVRVGPPIADAQGTDSPEEWKRVGASLMSAIADLLAEIRPQVPDRRRLKRSAA